MVYQYIILEEHICSYLTKLRS
uniref:Uncharacterized protein n=1 Tax=Arundo donax TaxID=35708 RepID=A0A0A9ET53_ARUDO